MLALTTAALSFNVAVRPSIAVARTVSPLKMGLVDDVKNSVVPADTSETLRNVMGWQMTGWGIGCTAAPAYMMTTLFASSISGPQVPLLRAMGLALLALGARVTGGSDDDAALSGLVFYGAWYKLLTAAGCTASSTGKPGVVERKFCGVPWPPEPKPKPPPPPAPRARCFWP